MNPYIEIPSIVLFSTAVLLFSSFNIAHNLSANGFTQIIQLVPVIFVLINYKYLIYYLSPIRIIQLIFIMLVLFFNGTNIFSALNLLFSILFFLSLSIFDKNRSFKFYKNTIDLFLMCLLFLFFIDLISIKYLWHLNHNSYFYRLKFLLMEPSYLGTYCALLFFISKNLNLRVFFVLLIILSQSYYAFFILVLIFSLSYATAYIFLIFLIGTTFFLYFNESYYFINSGFIRLVGIELFRDLDSNLFIGHGIRSGDLKLLQIFPSIFQWIGNGFLLSSIYDLGFLGFFIVASLYCETFFGFIFFIILALNFGLSTIYFPLFMYLFSLLGKAYSFFPKLTFNIEIR